jgi:hypothetical protein
MLFKILKLFGIDLPARMAEARIGVEERFDLAKDSVEQVAQTAAVLALLFFLGGLAALCAFGVGLMRSTVGCRGITANSTDLRQSAACCS